MNLDLSFFEPRSIVVIGASNKEGSYAARPLRNLVEQKYAGNLYVVNPSSTSVRGVTSYPTLQDLPEVPDMAVIAVNATAAVEALREAGRLGVRNAIIYAGGFKESGNSEGEQELRDIATKYNMCVLGPNGTGMMNLVDNVCASSTLFFRQGATLRSGSVAIITQSGGTGISLLRACSDRRIGLGYFLSVGNQACVTAVECADVLLDSPKVSVVALYVEGLGATGRDLLALGEKAKRLGKNVLVFKAGTSSLGQQLALTHTGAMSGPGEVTPALIKQSGLIYTETHEDLADLMALESFGEFAGRRSLAVLSTGGGFTVMSADACSKYHIPLARYTPETSKKMREFVPAFASVERNPSDITPFDADATALGAVVVALEAPEVDCVILVLGGEDLFHHLHQLEELADVSRNANTPLVIGLAGVDAFGILNPDVKAAVANAGIPVFSSPVRAIRALGLIGRFETQPSIERAPDSESVKNGAPNSPSAEVMRAWFEKYGVASPRDLTVGLRADLLVLVPQLNFPVVAKLIGDDEASHKSDLGLVRLGINGIEDLQRVRDEFVIIAEKLWPANDTLQLLVQEQVSSDSIEVLVGAVRHPEFGPVITVGSGGVLTELLRDVQYSLAPLGYDEAEAMLLRTKIARLLSGYRGDSGFDIDACVKAIVAVSRLISEIEELNEIEINPLMVARSGATAVDVRASFSAV